MLKYLTTFKLIKLKLLLILFEVKFAPMTYLHTRTFIHIHMPILRLLQYEMLYEPNAQV